VLYAHGRALGSTHGALYNSVPHGPWRTTIDEPVIGYAPHEQWKGSSMNTREDYHTRLAQTAVRLHDVDLGMVIGTCLAEVRTPLGVVHGYANLVGRSAVQPADCRDLLDQVGSHLNMLRDQYINDYLVDLYHLFMFERSHQAPADTAFDSGAHEPPRYPWNDPLDRTLRSIIQSMRQEAVAVQTLLHQFQERCAARYDHDYDVPQLIGLMQKHIDNLFDSIDILLEGVLLERIKHVHR